MWEIGELMSHRASLNLKYKSDSFLTCITRTHTKFPLFSDVFMRGFAKVAGFIGSCLRFLIYISLLLHSSNDITHSSLLQIPQYTPIIKSEEEQKWHKNKIIIPQKQSKIAKTCKYKNNGSKSSVLFEVWMKFIAETMWKQNKVKEGWVWSVLTKFFRDFPFILMWLLLLLFVCFVFFLFVQTQFYKLLPKVIAHDSR